MTRKGTVKRKTKETDITTEIILDGTGKYSIKTGMGFMDHMLETFSKHSMFDLNVNADGDLHVDFHHTVEDIGLTLGQAFQEALGDKAGITRFASSQVPMDEAMGECVIDISGRSALVYDVEIDNDERIGDFPVSLVREFFEAFIAESRITMHLSLPRGKNAHHVVEALFKACARALADAVAIDPRRRGEVPSTKGVL